MWDDEIEQEPEPTYRLRFHAYCGMSWNIGSGMTREEARREAAALIRRRRAQGHTVNVLTKGEHWEAEEPEGCLMVPDTAGTFSLSTE